MQLNKCARISSITPAEVGEVCLTLQNQSLTLPQATPLTDLAWGQAQPSWPLCCRLGGNIFLLACAVVEPFCSACWLLLIVLGLGCGVMLLPW